jgi:ATPase subunit of ABC transporter with duplicated ATPase domains
VPSLQYGYFSQEFEELDPEKTIIEEVSSGNKELAEKARTIMGCLHIARDKVFQKIGSLSFGEKNKTVLAKLIVSEYDVLLLDEPTNHLELETREELEKALVEFPGAVILVSHDRYLVERIADRIIKLVI